MNEGEERTLERPFSIQNNFIKDKVPNLANHRFNGRIPDDTGDSESGINGRCTPTETEGDGEIEASLNSSPSGKYFSLAGARPHRGSTKHIE